MRVRNGLIVLLAALAVGCAKNAEYAGAPTATQGAEAKASGVNRFLAYEHSVDIETDEDKVGALFNAAQAACRAAVADECAIISAQVSSGENAYASLKFRAKADGIQKLIGVLSSQGKVSSQSTTAEDLAGPIQDTAKQLAMLTDYRDKLEQLRNRGSADIDVLMKLTRELAEVQGQIEQLNGSQAGFMQRVNTEILNVSIRSTQSQSFWQPIANSASEFGEDFSLAVAIALTALAYLIPWGIVLLVIVWGVRRVLKWRRREHA